MDPANNMQTPAWQCRGRKVEFKEGALLMGILNVTPDSFSDGGLYAGAEQAVARARQMVEEGAAIIDVGGESSRPGAEPVDAATELRRVLPVIEGLSEKSAVLISVDTRKSAVADAALRAGAHIINDISALTADAGMLATARRHAAGVILMHKQGEPRDMQAAPRYGDVVAEVGAYLKDRVAALAKAGLPLEAMALDPGIGFGKTTAHNLQLIAHIAELANLGRPVVLGLSRKRFLGEITGRAVNARLAGSLAGLAYGLIHGVKILRVHDVGAARDACLVLQNIIRMRHSHALCGNIA